MKIKIQQDGKDVVLDVDDSVGALIQHQQSTISTMQERLNELQSGMLNEEKLGSLLEERLKQFRTTATGGNEDGKIDDKGDKPITRAEMNEMLQQWERQRTARASADEYVRSRLEAARKAYPFLDPQSKGYDKELSEKLVNHMKEHQIADALTVAQALFRDFDSAEAYRKGAGLTASSANRQEGSGFEILDGKGDHPGGKTLGLEDSIDKLDELDPQQAEAVINAAMLVEESSSGDEGNGAS